MGDLGSTPGSGRSPGEENGKPLQSSCLENPMDGGAWQATVHGVSKSRTRLGYFTFTFSRGSSQPRDQIQVSHIEVDFLTAEPQGKSKNTGMGSLSLLQKIFLAQELNCGILHCRWILYQLSYQESPHVILTGSQRFMLI